MENKVFTEFSYLFHSQLFSFSIFLLSSFDFLILRPTLLLEIDYELLRIENAIQGHDKKRIVISFAFFV